MVRVNRVSRVIKVRVRVKAIQVRASCCNGVSGTIGRYADSAPES